MSQEVDQMFTGYERHADDSSQDQPAPPADISGRGDVTPEENEQWVHRIISQHISNNKARTQPSAYPRSGAGLPRKACLP